LTSEIHSRSEDAENDGHEESHKPNEEKNDAGKVHEVTAFRFIAKGN
jgi:hypothetical protein